MKWSPPTISRLAFAPCLTGVTEDLQQRFIFVFIVGKDRMGVCNEEDVPLGRKPFKIGETFFEGIPVVSEIVGKIERASEFTEKPG